MLKSLFIIFFRLIYFIVNIKKLHILCERLFLAIIIFLFYILYIFLLIDVLCETVMPRNKEEANLP